MRALVHLLLLSAVLSGCDGLDRVEQRSEDPQGLSPSWRSAPLVVQPDSSQIEHDSTAARSVSPWTVVAEKPISQQQQDLIDAQNAIHECTEMWNQGVIKTHVEKEKCINPNEVKAAKASNYPYMDLVDLLNAKSIEIAEKIDKKKITEAQGQLELAQMTSYLTEEQNKRNIEISNAQAQASIAYAAQNQAEAAQSQADATQNQATASLLTPQIQQPIQKPVQQPLGITNCDMYGNMLNCRSY